jgi:hypothetical protein
MVAVVLKTLVGFIPEEAWKSAGQAGFLAILVLILLVFLYLQRKEEREERRENRRSIDRLTRSVTDLLLSAHFVPPVIREAAKETQRDLDQERDNP